MRRVFILLATLVASYAQAHQTKWGITRVVFNERNGNIEIMHRFYVHDVEHALSQISGKKRYLLENREAQEAFATYVTEHFAMGLGSATPVQLTTVGQEVEGKFIWVYQELPIPAAEQTLWFRFDALQERWPEQVNQINVESRGNVHSLNFTRDSKWQSLEIEWVATVRYLANAGVMVARGSTKILFDPLFEDTYVQYGILPASMREALLAGAPPFEGIDAVLVSHVHGDHFSPTRILELLDTQKGIQLIAPRQAADALLALADGRDLSDRVTVIELDNGDVPVTLEFDGLLVEAVRVPHAGWPTRMADVENVVYRVTLDEQVTAMHLGDADADHAHFEANPEHWSARPTHVAFVPYWFLTDRDARQILIHQIQAQHTSGVHVPATIPQDSAARPPEFRGLELSTTPGMTRMMDSTEH